LHFAVLSVRHTPFEKYVIKMLSESLWVVNPTEVNQNPVFNKHVALPLRSIENFKYFEEELLKEDVKLNLVG
jgi:hypothetical protein